jgi:hypothetical protein
MGWHNILEPVPTHMSEVCGGSTDGHEFWANWADALRSVLSWDEVACQSATPVAGPLLARAPHSQFLVQDAPPEVLACAFTCVGPNATAQTPA